MDPLHATIEEFAAEGYTHIEANCPRCRVIRLRPMSWLPKISMGLTLDALAHRLRCAECGGPLLRVKPWRQADGRFLCVDHFRQRTFRDSQSPRTNSSAECLLSGVKRT